MNFSNIGFYFLDVKDEFLEQYKDYWISKEER